MSQAARPDSNPYLDEINQLWEDILKQYPAALSRGIRGWWQWLRSAALRQACYAQRVPLDTKYSFAIPNEEALSRLAQLGPLLELGAGTGYWGWMLQIRRVDVLLYDIEPTKYGRNLWHADSKPWTKVSQGSVEVLKAHPQRTLFLCWPPYDSPMASEAIKLYTGNTLAYVGHMARGNTGDREFHQLLCDDWTLQDTVNLPNWSDFSNTNVFTVPHDIGWYEASRYFDDGRDKLFIFQRNA